MKTLINIKADKGIKEDAQKIAADLGFSLSAVVNAYLRQFVRNKEVYFGLSPKMSSGLEKLLGEVEKDIKKNKNISPVLTSKREIKEYLSSL
jgi:addiction module RelB/DinJ family antitoxin